MSRWRWAWGELTFDIQACWERQKELDALGWYRWERFWTYISWPLGCLVAALLLLPMIALTWDPGTSKDVKP